VALALEAFAVPLAGTGGQPVTAIFVSCVITAPFWAVMLVGISRVAATVFLTLTFTFLLWPLTRFVTFFVLVTVFVRPQKL